MEDKIRKVIREQIKKLKENISDQEYYSYLNDLRDSGVTNMFGAGAYLERDFNLDKREARKILSNWMSDLKKEGMSDEEWADAKEADRLAQHPEKDKINKIKQMMDKEKSRADWTPPPMGMGGEEDEEQEEYDKGWYGEGTDKEKEDKIDTIKKIHPKTDTDPLKKLAGLKETATELGYLKEDYKPSVRAYNVIDKSNNDKIIAKELPRHKALELAKTKEEYMIDATDRLAEFNTVDTRGDMPSLGQYDAEPEGSEYWAYEDIESMMEELPEGTKVTVPDFSIKNVGEPVQKVHQIFQKGATNIGYTLQGWLEEFRREYPQLKFDVTGVAIPMRATMGWGFEDRETPIDITIKALSNYDSDYDLAFKSAEKYKNLNNKDTLGLTSPYGNKLDKWS